MARPAAGQEKKRSNQIVLRVSDELLAALNSCAKQRGKLRSDLMHEMLCQALDVEVRPGVTSPDHERCSF